MKKSFNIRCKWWVFLLLALSFFACDQDTDTLFRLVPPSESGIHFSNRIVESDSINVLENEYVYNGGGVALADFNHDGLLDVYMTGNMVENALYLNEGNFKFVDITEAAGVGNGNRWSSGTCIVDINEDGWDDVYVAATHRPGLTQRSNALFIHQGLDEAGIPHFKDEAKAYGLADTSYTTTAAFFDYDNDGDLDVFLAIDAMIPDRQPHKFKEKSVDGSTDRTDKLFRNEGADSLGHPFFVDVSREAGILIEGYSLGLNITDINRDGWKDIFVTNDYVSNDLLYINQGDGTFQDQASQYFKHTSYAAMGNDVVDMNSDGMVDIVCLDMLPEDNYRRKTRLGDNNYTNYLNNDRFGYNFQYVRNTFQVNQGRLVDTLVPVFSDLAMYAGIAATDWSWCPLVADFDNDGYRDIIITNGFPKDVRDRDFIDYWSDVDAYAPQSMLLKKIPSVKISNYGYRNTGGLRFEDATDDWGLRRNSFSNGAAYGDLDNDGDLDYIVNNIDDSAFVYQNRLYDAPEPGNNWLRLALAGPDKNPKGTGAILEVRGGGLQQHWEHNPSRGYLSSIEPYAHFGLGTMTQVDELRITWPDGKVQVLTDVPARQVLHLDYADAKAPAPDQSLEEESTQLFSALSAQEGLDFEHPESDYIDFNAQSMLPHKLSQYGPALAVSDVNGDGLEDVYIGGSHFNKGRFAIQQADGNFQVQDLLPGVEGDEKKEEELGALFFDADGDGDEDLYLVSGGYEFSLTDPSYQDRIFENVKGKFVLKKDALPAFLSSGFCVKAADYDKDGDLDLFVGARVDPSLYPKSVRSFLLKNESGTAGIRFSIDQDAAPILENIGMIRDALWTDFDNNGSFDLLLAGEQMSLTLLKNTEGIFEDVTQSANLWDKKGYWNSLAAGDFDRDGDIDYVAGNLGLNVGFRDPEAFSNLSNYFESSLVENLGDGTFILTALPEAAQMAPMYGMLIEDFDGDALVDVLMLGNDLGAKKDIWPCDAFNGLVLKGDGKGAFRALSLAASGFYVPGDGKSLVRLQDGEGNTRIFAAQNSDKLKVFGQRIASQYVPLTAMEFSGYFHFPDGTKQVWELGYGTSFLSQSSRSLQVPEGVTAVEIHDTQGKMRRVE